MCRNKFAVAIMIFIVKITGLPLAWLYLKPRIKRLGEKRLPKNCIIISNHNTLMDFVLYLLIFPFRTIRFLMAEVLFNKGALFAKFLYLIGGIHVDRDAKDFGFVSDALEVLDDGGTVGIFPEGRLPINGKPFPFTASTAYIALHTDAKIIPIYTDGNYGINRRANVVIGKSLDIRTLKKEGLDDNAQLEHLTNQLHDIVYGLKEHIK